MVQIIHPGCRHGEINAPISKSDLHRQLICAALSDTNSSIFCDQQSDDILATIICLKCLGADIQNMDFNQIIINPIHHTHFDNTVDLNCRESGSTLRFLLPITAALGITARFFLKGNLSDRPIKPLLDVLNQNGATIMKEDQMISVSGQLQSGIFPIPGNISSQFISGLLFALPLLKNESQIIITENIESKPYIDMTEKHLYKAGIHFKKEKNRYVIPGRQNYHISGHQTAEKDWSNAANFLCMGAFSSKGIVVKGLDIHSPQGDKLILEILNHFGAIVSVRNDQITIRKGELVGQTIDARHIPDLIPAISVIGACSKGITKIKNAQRLRMKESDRLKSTYEMLTSLGADIHLTSDGLMIHGKNRLNGGFCHCSKDHRIAMAAAIAGCCAEKDIVIMDSECVAKSYPNFWNDMNLLRLI